jgi:hypothetical protein
LAPQLETSSEINRINKVAALTPSGLSTDAFSDCSSPAMTFCDPSHPRDSISRRSFTSIPLQSPAPILLHSRFVEKLAGSPHRETENDDDNKNCELIWPILVSEIRQILRLSGGSVRTGDRLDIPADLETIEGATFRFR